MLPFKPPRLSVVAHSPRIPPGNQLNVPQPGFSPLYIFYVGVCVNDNVNDDANQNENDS